MAERMVLEEHLELKPVWMGQAACRNLDPALFYPDKLCMGDKEYDRAVAQAKVFCRSCEVRSECLDYALKNREPAGVWGCESEEERRKTSRTPLAPNRYV